MRFEYILSMLPHFAAHVTADLLYFTTDFYMSRHGTVLFLFKYIIYIKNNIEYHVAA